MNRRDSKCSIIIDSVTTTVDLQNMVHRKFDVDIGSADLGGATPQSSGQEYAIRKLCPEWSEESGLAWNERICKLFPSWESQTSALPQVYPVDAGTTDYVKVAGMLFDSEGSLTKESHEICQILRVQNLERLIKYVSERDSILRSGKGDIFRFFSSFFTYRCYFAQN
jgi:hypothetical protein